MTAPVSPEFDPARILAELGSAGVEYIVIGGIAAAVHGSPYVTTDIDVTPARSRENLRRLSDALRALDARIRTEGVEGALAFDHSAESLDRATVWNLTTIAGDLDLAIIPSGTSGYADLRASAIEVDLLGSVVLVAALEDVIRSKEAAGREKDRYQLPLLRRLLDESG